MKRICLIVIVLITVTMSIFSFNLYQKSQKIESEILRKELLIFQNHITGTVRAIDDKDKNLLEDTLLRISTFETFHSQFISIDSNAQRVLDVYEQGLHYLIKADISNYGEVRANLNDVFDTLTSYKDEKLNKERFFKIINEVLSQVEKFRDDAKNMSEE